MARRHASREEFCTVIAHFQERELLALLGVTKRTLSRWRSGAVRVPWAAYQLAYDRSQYGLSERDAAEHFNRLMLEQANAALEAKVTRLEHIVADQARRIDWGAANDPFIWPTDPRSSARK